MPTYGYGSTVSGNDTWPAWTSSVSTTNTSTTASAANAWFQWNGSYGSMTVGSNFPTAAELEAERAAKLAKEAMAGERAEALLRSHLTPAQQSHLDVHGSFIVKGLKNEYRIRRGLVGNVDELDKVGRVVARLCIHAKDIPVADNMLAQKLMIEGAEPLFLQTANRTLVPVAA